VKDAETVLPLMLQLGEVIRKVSLCVVPAFNDDSWQLTSELLKPVPCTVTRVPRGPSEGIAIMVGVNGLLTVNVAEIEMPLGLAVTVIVYGPCATLATTKLDPVIFLPITPWYTSFTTMHDEDAMTLPDPEIEQ
jgi:hypothetical protein